MLQPLKPPRTKVCAGKARALVTVKTGAALSKASSAKRYSPPAGMFSVRLGRRPAEESVAGTPSVISVLPSGALMSTVLQSSLAILNW